MALRRLLPETIRAGLADLVAQRLGLHFPPQRQRDIERGIAAAAGELGFADAQSCARALLSTPPTDAEVSILASHLTVGETYFFRESDSFAALEQHILPELLRERLDAGRQLRIWCAGCCTGEEAYSVAMLLDRLLPGAETWNVTILGTDINPRFLCQANQAIYGEWSFRTTPGWLRARYFTGRSDGRYALQPRIRNKVTFSQLNLADDTYPSLAAHTNAIDVILCRNVLMYFTAQRARRVVENFQRAMASGGYLIVSPAETSSTLYAPLTPVQWPGVLVYRKAPDGSLPAAEIPPAHSRHQGQPLSEQTLPQQQPPVEVTAAESAHALAQVSDDPGAQVRAARHCAGEGRLDEAADWCQKVLEADRLNPAHHYLLASIRQEQGQFEAAAQALTRALYLDPDFALAHFALGSLLQAQGRHAQAERHLANALRVLQARGQDEALPEAEGLTAGRLAEIINGARAGRPRATA